MAKKSRVSPHPGSRAQRAAPASVDVPEVGAREACPCGSGRRYKACHGRRAKAEAAQFVARPFEGLPSECDWVALREFVPAATSPLPLGGEHAGRSATVATLLPMAWAGMVREDGEPMLALQVPGGSGDPSRDYAAVLEQLLTLEPGGTVESADPAAGRRLQDLLDPEARLDVTVHDSFEYWADTVPDPTGLVAASRERADAAAFPSARLASVEAAYWCRTGEREYLRWVRPEPEDALVDALARLHVRGEDLVGGGSRQVGAFRAHGLLVLVWDLPAESDPAALAEPAAEFEARLAEATATDSALTGPERAARSGLINRQRTLR